MEFCHFELELKLAVIWRCMIIWLPYAVTTIHGFHCTLIIAGMIAW